MITDGCRRIRGGFVLVSVVLVCSRAAHADSLISAMSGQEYSISARAAIVNWDSDPYPGVVSWSDVSRQGLSYSNGNSVSTTYGGATAASSASLTASFSPDTFSVSGTLAGSGSSGSDLFSSPTATILIAFNFGVTGVPLAYAVSGDVAVQTVQGGTLPNISGFLQGYSVAGAGEYLPFVSFPPNSQVSPASLNIPIGCSGIFGAGGGDLWLTAMCDLGSQMSFDLQFVLHLPGDINGDGLVDVADYNIWAADVGMTNATWSQGDLNGDGLVDVADYNIWAANVGRTAGVPEPAMMTLLALGGLAFLRRKAAAR
jgi:hypothetical protein